MAATLFRDEPPFEIADWLQRRQALGQDGHDEVGDGVYHVAPMDHRRRGDVSAQVGELLAPRARRAGLWPSDPLNIGDPHDYRVPDRACLRDRDMATYLPSAAVVVEAADGFERINHSDLLDLGEATLHGEIDWPPA